tara:strand:+ start:221 stop:421 length:201 start_codon:yes stop_codon:yes gene_type:complete
MKNQAIELAKNKTLESIDTSKEVISNLLEKAAAGDEDIELIVNLIIEELDTLAKADERLEMLEKYF